jgi:hypothetical protein
VVSGGNFEVKLKQVVAIKITSMNVTPVLRALSNSTDCKVQIAGWCGFSQAEQTGIILGFIVLFLAACCSYCISVKDPKGMDYD